MNPWAPWLAASPDRKVYDPSRDPPFGLLEIKCPTCKTPREAECLVEDAGKLRLKGQHNYFRQILFQLAVTGLPWCDFYVWCTDGMHYETIYFQEHISKWQEMKDKILEVEEVRAIYIIVVQSIRETSRPISVNLIIFLANIMCSR